jgi:hypothetical protein
MGEYAKYNNQEIKIGTCETMYYLRYEDRHKVKAIKGNVDPVRDAEGLRFRVPLFSEDGIEPGHYRSHTNDGIRLYKKGEEGCIDYDLTDGEAGRISFRDETSGLQYQFRVCMGTQQESKLFGTDVRLGFNGYRSPSILKYLKVHGGLVVPVISCTHCDEEWRTTWGAIWDYIPNGFEDYRDRFISTIKPSWKQKKLNF